MSKIGVFGGSFDPVHLGHINAAREVKDLLGLERVLFVPAKIQPLKAKLDHISEEERREILALALKQDPSFELSDMELRRSGKSYTVDTLSKLGETIAAEDLYFIVGFDTFSKIEQWKEPSRLLSLANFVIIDRPKDPSNGPIFDLNQLKLIAQKWGYCYNNIKSIDNLEAKLKNGQNYDNKEQNSRFSADSAPLPKGDSSPRSQIQNFSTEHLSTEQLSTKQLSSRQRTPYMLGTFTNNMGLKLIGVAVTPHPISSSQIRQRLRMGQTISDLVPAEIETHIKEAYTKT